MMTLRFCRGDEAVTGKWGIFVKLLSTALLTALGFAVLASLALGQLRQAMVEDRIANVRNLAEVARDTVRGFHERAKAGEFDEATARAQAVETLRRVRYQGQEYFFVYAFDGTSVLLPPKPEREGKNLLDLKDSDGIPFIQQLIEASRKGGGTVFYKFPRSGSDIPADKVSYAAGFEPWGWAIGTGLYIDDIDAEYRTAAWRFAAVTAAVMLVSLGLVLLLARHIAAPLTRLAALTQRLTQHDYAVDIGETQRGDEIGLLARSIRLLRDEVAEAAEQRALKQQDYAKSSAERRAARLAMADNVERSIHRVAGVVITASGEMEGAACVVTDALRNAGDQAVAVAAAAEQASANVATVATAAEQLSASISEIARQVTQSSSISGQAVGEAERTNALVLSLAEAAGRIGEVVTLINDIAGQTNLLALNATIEAARAGDAGKGFAVVANEVKTLANQTAKATDEISTQIGTVQTRTREAVDAIRNIGGTIGRINDIAAAIAAAVEQQGAATAEIARNVQQAASGTHEVTAVLGHLSAATADAGTSAGIVQEIAKRLTAEAGCLNDEVGRFLLSVRNDNGAGG
jgi:methyl-accepting chemotaxis protein